MRLILLLQLVHLAAAFLSRSPVTSSQTSVGRRIVALLAEVQPTEFPKRDVLIWYQCVDPEGGPYRNVEPYAARFTPDALCFELCDTVADRNKKLLSDVDATALKAFATRDDLLLNRPLKPYYPLANLALTAYDSPLYILVPPSEVPLDYLATPFVLQPSSERTKRWQLLNPILDRNKKSRNDGEGVTTPYSAVTWADVREVYEPVRIEWQLNPKMIPEELFKSLHEYITKASTSFGQVIEGNEAMRLHFIAPILVHVCQLFEGEITILVEENLNGKNVHVNGRFEFILQRNQKRFCILEAKRDDMMQGLAQNLLGCEAVSEIEGLDCVYGVVTNYIEWIFLKSLDNRIEKIESSLTIQKKVPTKESLELVAGYIYAMLSE